ncbi:kinase-like protein [Xylaria curta]|nr:kinase-like protein [Xylaria curta]
MSMSMSGMNRRRQAPPQAFGSEITSLRDDVEAPRVKSKKDQAEEGKYTLLSCLACAQHRRVDFTGFSWINAQGTLGRGGQGVVAQTRASVDTVFAFKRRRPTSQGPLNIWAAAAKDHAFREICSEIMALGHEDLRRHDNIVQLIAISWEIENVKDWKFKSNTVIWPVMILEKAELGDLGRFLRGKGVETDLMTRLRMCAGIASALGVVHKNGIVHGDIKPDNALVFAGGVVKLSDFGFSALASNKLFDLAGTYPWRAPEIISLDGATHQQAKLTDLYSFGMLCLWVIFRNELAEIGEMPEPPPLLRRASSSLAGGLSSTLSWLSTGRSSTAAPGTPDLEHLKRFNTTNESTNEMPKRAQKLVEGLPEDKIRNYLGPLFARLLSFKASSRAFQDTATDFEQISQSLLDISSNDEPRPIKSNDAPQKDNRSTPEAFPRGREFQVFNSLESLCHADFRVRKHIFDCLLQEYNEAKDDDSTKATLAAQLAFCEEVGFGTVKHSATNDTYRRVGQLEAIQLQNMIDSTRTSQKPFNARLRALCASGIIQPIHYGTDFRSATDPNLLEEMEKSRKEEIERMEMILGKTHPAVLNLKWSLSTLLMDHLNHLRPITHLHKMVLELEADPKYGPFHRDSLITRVYFCLSLNRLVGPSTAETIIAYSKETYTAVVEHGLADHVVTLQLSVHISDLAAQMGYTQESMRFLQLAQLDTDKKFGPEHPNTVILLDKKTDRLMQEGKLAEALDNLKQISNRIEGLVDGEDNVKPYLRRKNAALFAMGSHFKEALALVENDFATMRARGIPKDHPAYLESLMMKAEMLVELGRFEEAAACARNVIQPLRGIPWPPHQPPADVRGDGGGPQDGMRSAVEELAELLGKSKMVTAEKDASDLEGPAPEEPSFNPDMFPAHPWLLGAEIALVTALHAQAHQLTAAEIMGDGHAVALSSAAHKEVALLSRTADNDLDGLLRAVGEKLEGDMGIVTARVTATQSTVDPTEATCRASSAILSTMDMGFAMLVELLASLGMRNAREGLHYDKSLAAARRMKARRVEDILTEHRLLCVDNEPAADAPAMFGSAKALVDWVEGKWTGTYLYENGGDRKNLTGRKTMTLKASPAAASGEEGWDADVEGTSRDDMGDWVIKGQAWVSGRIVLHIFHREGNEEQGWEYTGYANLMGCSCGGYWGIRNFKRERSGGTFLFYNFI